MAAGHAAKPLVAPLARRVLALVRREGDSVGLPHRVKVTTWGAPLAQARLTVVYAGGAPTSCEEIPLHSLASGDGSADIYAERGIHLVAIDKPGMGGTELNPRFRIRRDYPRLVARVCDQLGVDSFAVLGISNGGPHVMALLTARDEATRRRVLAAAMVVGVSDVSASGYFSPAHPSGLFEGVFNSLPLSIGGPLIWAAASAGALVLFGPPFRAYARVAPEALRSDAAAALVRRVIADGVANAGRGFALDAQQGLSPLHARPRADGADELSAETAYRRINVPVALWYGDADATVPLRTADWLAERIPTSTKHYIRGAGHGLYLAPGHAAAVLDDLLAKARSHDENH